MSFSLTDELFRTTEILFAPGQIIEVRAIIDDGMASGYFDDLEKLVAQVEALDGLNRTFSGLLRRTDYGAYSLITRDKETGEETLLQQGSLSEEVSASNEMFSKHNIAEDVPPSFVIVPGKGLFIDSIPVIKTWKSIGKKSWYGWYATYVEKVSYSPKSGDSQESCVD